MKVHCICVVKNEGDIIRASLMAACEWADNIFVLDNGSEDDTWEIVKELSEKHGKIVAWKQSYEVFSDAIRASVFNEFRHLAESGDWWCIRLDADEFYVQSPKLFLKTIEKYAQVVCSKHIQYNLTKEEVVADQLMGKEFTENDLRQRLVYYDPVATSEIRFLRHRENLIWREDQEIPSPAGIVSSVRIIIKHYQYRSIAQIEKRIQTRLMLKQKHPGLFPHVFSEKAKDYLKSTKDLIRDKGSMAEYLHLPYRADIPLKYRWWVLLIRRFLYFIDMNK